MLGLRNSLALIVAAIVFAVAMPVRADQAARDAGVLNGVVVAVDYQSGVLELQLQHPRKGEGRIKITVLPSTHIEGNDDTYRTIADIVQGSHVSIYASEEDGKLVAQIIKIR